MLKQYFCLCLIVLLVCNNVVAMNKVIKQEEDQEIFIKKDFSNDELKLFGKKLEETFKKSGSDELKKFLTNVTSPKYLKKINKYCTTLDMKKKKEEAANWFCKLVSSPEKIISTGCIAYGVSTLFLPGSFGLVGLLIRSTICYIPGNTSYYSLNFIGSSAIEMFLYSFGIMNLFWSRSKQLEKCHVVNKLCLLQEKIEELKEKQKESNV